MVFAAGAGIAFMYVSPESAHPALLWIAGAIGVQLRLLCNMLDGMLAIEGGMKSKLGDLWNDIPDRLSDTFILVGAGYGVEWLVPGGSALGWCAALFAAITAYVRVLGGALGTPQYFTGPMAKQHRMFVVTLGALVSALQSVWTRPGLAMAPALVIIVVGSAMTTVRRIEAIARDLQK
jgi:phosphatidylglycerophosphate synthase